MCGGSAMSRAKQGGVHDALRQLFDLLVAESATLPESADGLEKMREIVTALRTVVDAREELGLECYPFVEFERGFREIIELQEEGPIVDDGADPAANAGTNSVAGNDHDEHVVVSIVTRTDYFVDTGSLPGPDPEIGLHLYQAAHRRGSWDALPEEPWIDPIVRVVFVATPRAAITEDQLSDPVPDPALLEVSDDDVLFVDSGVWGPLPQAGPQAGPDPA